VSFGTTRDAGGVRDAWLHGITGGARFDMDATPFELTVGMSGYRIISNVDATPFGSTIPNEGDSGSKDVVLSRLIGDTSSDKNIAILSQDASPHNPNSAVNFDSDVAPHGLTMGVYLMTRGADLLTGDVLLDTAAAPHGLTRDTIFVKGTALPGPSSGVRFDSNIVLHGSTVCADLLTRNTILDKDATPHGPTRDMIIVKGMMPH